VNNQEKERNEVDHYVATVINDAEEAGGPEAGIMAALMDIAASLRITNQLLEEKR